MRVLLPAPVAKAVVVIVDMARRDLCKIRLDIAAIVQAFMNDIPAVLANILRSC